MPNSLLLQLTFAVPVQVLLILFYQVCSFFERHAVRSSS